MARGNYFWRRVILDVAVVMALAAVGVSAQQSPISIEMVAENFDYNPKQIRVAPGQDVRLTLVNRSDAPHNVEFEFPTGEVMFDQSVSPGSTKTLTFTAPTRSGTYVFYCPVGNHHARGMEGQLIVGKADITKINIQKDSGKMMAVQNSAFAKMRSPQRLAREIRNELLTLPYYSVFDWIEFEVDPNGVVTLRGQVTAPPDIKSTAEAYVQDVEGVTRIVNNIETLPVSPNDERLRRSLYRQIYSGPLFRYQIGSLQSIHIIVRNGRATLKGVVNSEGDKNIAGIRAKTVSGVFEVNNELVVRNDSRSN